MPETSDTFGARLRHQREDRQIDLIAIAGQTKIKLSLLEGLERGDVSHWPSGIFRRAYIRTYAQMIGLDPDATLREFLEVYPDPGCDVFAALPGALGMPAEDSAASPSGPPTRLRTMVESAFESLARRRKAAGPEDAAPASPPVQAAAPIAVKPPIAAEPPLADVVLFSSPVSAVAKDVDVARITLPEIVQPPAAPQLTIEMPAEAVVEAAPTASAPIAPVQSDAAMAVSVLQQAEAAATLETVAHLCTELGRVVDRQQVRALLQDAAGALHASGLIVWLWNDTAEELRPVLAHGYSDRVLAHLPPVTRDDDNATAIAFRTASPREMAGTPHAGGALVVPLLSPDGCEGVLAIEMKGGMEPARSGRAVAALLAAALTQLVVRCRPVEAQTPTPIERTVANVATMRPAVRPVVKVRR